MTVKEQLATVNTVLSRVGDLRSDQAQAGRTDAKLSHLEPVLMHLGMLRTELIILSKLEAISSIHGNIESQRQAINELMLEVEDLKRKILL